MSVLLKLARKVLDQVLQELTKQINRMEQEVLEQMVKLVTQGFDDVWRGPDAQQFVEKVQRVAVPQAQQCIQTSTATGTGLQRAAEIITRADQQVAQKVNDLNQVFSRIFN